MREIDGRLLLSATGLMNYLGCPHAIFLDLHRPTGATPNGDVDEEEELLKQKGIEHEQRYRDHLIAQGLQVTQIETNTSLDKQIAATLAAIRRGDTVVYQAALARTPWHGHVDFLERVEMPSALGDYSYEIVDTKLARSPKAKYLVQLSVYAHLLETVQGSAPHGIHIVLGNNERVGFRLADFVHYVNLARERLCGYVASPPKSSRPEPCNYCERCRWSEHCEKEWERVDHLWLIANIQRSHIRKLNDAEVETVRQFAGKPDTWKAPGIGPETLARLRSQARLQISKRDTGKDTCEILPIEPARGFNRLPKPDAADLFFDMEGDPHFPDGLEYLFGFGYLNGNEFQFKPFWAHDREQEKVAFEQAMDFIVSRLQKHPNAHVYHYHHYEPTAFKRLAAYYGTREEQLDWLLRNQKFVDLYKVVREGIRTSQSGYSLKDIEIFYMPPRTGAVKTAGDSVVMYEKYCATGDAALLAEIQSYNAEDCRSTHLLRNWLLSLRPAAATWFTPEHKELAPEKLEAIQEAQVKRADLEERLHGCDPALSDFRQLICDLLDFHRREQKPQWWKMFDLREQTDEELVDDPECLGALTLSKTRPPHVEKQSRVYTYEFPEQETKLDVGSECHVAATLDRAGTIVALDLKKRTVAIKRGIRSGPLPEKFSATPPPPLDAHSLRDALFRFAEAEASGSNPYQAARSLLLRELPHLTGLKAGQPVTDGAATTEAVIEAVARLRDSFLLIQGPPGSGKTYTASHAIVEMLKRGKRVGVASNSHKAIHNLLGEVERVAFERGVSFRGVKKASDRNKESFFHGKLIENVTSNREISGGYNLVAGTVYMYAELGAKLDYLFVDEAGQVCLANAIIMAMCARNLVLVGDQMQLAQPIQGVHPGKSGLSVLEYVLQDAATIPPERGIFLDTTRRMHGDICTFISDAVYDGRLRPHPENQPQALVLDGSADPALRPTGIRFVEVEHEGCSQRSEEEGAVIRKLYHNLLAQRYRDRDGNVRRITPRDIIVITPYNMQVNYLESILPPGARVGTVDKLQGQQAEVVLVSMVTSSGDDLPRDVEFLYSKNRLNVAISRARTLACIVASPRLLEVECHTVEQLKLVNTLCWAKEFAAGG